VPKTLTTDSLRLNQQLIWQAMVRLPKKCSTWLEEQTDCGKALLTHSCTAALEMMALLVDIKPGDEIIMPSYTFVSTPNAFVLRGGILVFVDIREDTLNLDEKLIEAAITKRTRAIVVVHCAGVACEMDVLMGIAKRHNLWLLEDAAQGVRANYKGRALCSIGHLGAYSFHETKNIISGEGGALLINNPEITLHAEIIREKGTDRTRFLRGEVDKYTWQEVGSSFLPGELIAAFLWAQLEQADKITKVRLENWRRYHALIEPLEANGNLRRPIIPSEREHNGHMYYVLLNQDTDRQKVLSDFKKNNIASVVHYVPLHSSPDGERYARTAGNMTITDMQSERLVRLPMWVGITQEQEEKVVNTLANLI